MDINGMTLPIPIPCLKGTGKNKKEKSGGTTEIPLLPVGHEHHLL